MKKLKLQKNNTQNFFNNLSLEKKKAAKEYVQNLGQATVDALNLSNKDKED